MKKQRWEEPEKRREEKNREEQRRKKIREEKGSSQKTEDAGARKKWQRREARFLQWFVAAEGRKVGSLKRRVRSCLGRWEMKNCTLLWREAHFQVKMYKTRHFWALRCRKSARRCGAKHISKSKRTKHTRFGALLEVQMSKKCTSFWRETHSKSKVQKTDGHGTFLDVQVSFQVAGARDCAPKGFAAFPKPMAGVGHLKRICKDAFSVAGAVQETCSSEMLEGQGADFLRGLHLGASDLQVCWDDFAWQVQHFVWPGIELLRFRCCEVKTIRNSCRIATFSMLSSLESSTCHGNLQAEVWGVYVLELLM